MPKGLPILIMSGDMDPVGQFGEGPEEGGGLAERGRGCGLDPQAVRGARGTSCITNSTGTRWSLIWCPGWKTIREGYET